MHRCYEWDRDEKVSFALEMDITTGILSLVNLIVLRHTTYTFIVFGLLMFLIGTDIPIVEKGINGCWQFITLFMLAIEFPVLVAAHEFNLDGYTLSYGICLTIFVLLLNYIYSCQIKSKLFYKTYSFMFIVNIVMIFISFLRYNYIIGLYHIGLYLTCILVNYFKFKRGHRYD